MNAQHTARLWREYDAAAEWCARRKLSGAVGCALPPLISCSALRRINYDPEAFAERVRATAYALACEAHAKARGENGGAQ